MENSYCLQFSRKSCHVHSQNLTVTYQRGYGWSFFQIWMLVFAPQKNSMLVFASQENSMLVFNFLKFKCRISHFQSCYHKICRWGSSVVPYSQFWLPPLLLPSVLTESYCHPKNVYHWVNWSPKCLIDKIQKLE